MRKKSAGIDLCRADVVDWLARQRSVAEFALPGEGDVLGLDDDYWTSTANDKLWQLDLAATRNSDLSEKLRSRVGHTVVDQLETVANELLSGAVEDIKRELGDPIPDRVKVALADHVWCSLLAELAHVLDEGLKLLDSVPDRVVDLVMRSRKETRWRHIEQRVLRIAARSIWNKIRLLTFFGLLNRKIALPVVRMLAVLSCKAPERHKAVVEYCIDPLGKQLLTETKSRLKNVLSDWLPRLTASGAGLR